MLTLKLVGQQQRKVASRRIQGGVYGSFSKLTRGPCLSEPLGVGQPAIK